jgi:DNA-binding GntR family transcriptional regulator
MESDIGAFEESDRRLSDRAAGYLRQLIYRGVLRPGERIIETEICERLDISRAPVREALVTLKSQGLITIRPHKGAVVSKFSAADLEEISELRAALEGLAAERICARINVEGRRQLAVVAAKMEEAATHSDSSLTAEAHIEFHHTIGDVSGSSRLAGFLDQLLSQNFALLGYSEIEQDELLKLAREHKRILRILETGAPGEGREALQAHILAPSAAIRRVLDRMMDTDPGMGQRHASGRGDREASSR